MDTERRARIAVTVEGFKLPRYEEIPDVGLFLEQTVKYVNSYLSALPGAAITGSMVGNYVKMGLVANPVKKQYDRERIAYIFFIAVVKPVLSLDQIKLFMGLQKRTYPADVAYGYFREELKNVLDVVFGLKDKLDAVGSDRMTDEKDMLRNTIITVAHKIYLDRFFEAVANEDSRGEES